jgi:2-phosphoglycerate kinase
VAAKVILLGGGSHLGKSSVAATLARRLCREARSTDYLARHPGRPWPRPDWQVPPHVVEHYRDLTHEARLDSVLAHYRRLAPTIGDIVRAHLATEGSALVLEGSALLPQTVAELTAPGVASVLLTADPATVTRRMRAESGYDDADADGRALIDAFLERSLRFDRLVVADAEARGQAVLREGDDETVESVADRVLALAVGAQTGVISTDP